MRVDASYVLVGASLRESGNPDAIQNSLQDFCQVLVGDVQNGEACFVVLVEGEPFVECNRFVVTLLKEEGDWPEGFEFGFPFCSAVSRWWRWLQVAKAFLVGESTWKVRFAAFLYDRFDHVSVSRSFVPESPEAVEPLIKLDVVGVDVGGVGGGEGETDPWGSSA